MIEPKRLEELIKQGGKIWYEGHFEIELNPEQYSIREAFGTTLLWYQPKDEPSGYDWSWELDVLREDVDRAKWEYDMYTARIERFEPPMWEDIERYYDYIFVLDNIQVIFAVEKQNSITVQSCIDNYFEKYASDVTKENYEKACEIVRDLFKGEK